ncbi:MAG: thiamine pyrophosphate-binding protein [Caldilineaceae bacterium]|nr:thiamine pyrophosphate-binding protein [Caldilineaceae bacterium]
MPTCAEVLARSLHDLGVRTVFGLPGGENVRILDALREQGVEFVLVRNESSAAYAASARWTLTGELQACLTTLGPGITHAAAGVGHLWLDRAGVVVISACTAEASGPMHTHQVLDQEHLMAPMVKAHIKVEPDNIHAVRDVCSLATEGRPGPVYVQISNEVAGWPAAGGGTDPEPRPAKPEPDMDGVEKALALMARARRPVVVAGLGARDASLRISVQAVAGSLQAPIVATPKAKGIVPDSHPLAAGVIGLTRTDPVYEILEQADLVIAVGFDVVELVLPWEFDGALVWVAEWPNVDPPLPADVELTGNVAGHLGALAQAAESATGWIDTDFHAFRRDRTVPAPKAAAEGRVSPQAVMRSLRRYSDPDAIMTVDVGSHKIHFALDWPTHDVSGFLLSNGLSCMGFGLAGAIGAATLDPGRQVLCVIGDGGLSMCVGELGLLRELGVNVKVVVMQDEALDLIRVAQLRAGSPVQGTEYGVSVDHARLAAAFGITGRRVTDDTSLDDAVRTACAQTGPYLVEVMLDPESYPTFPSTLDGRGATYPQ